MMRSDRDNSVENEANNAFEHGYYKTLNGKVAAELSAMSDDALATWQAGWKPSTPNFILAEKEWQRRMLTHEFGLNKRLADFNAKWLMFAACLGVAGTIVGAVVGAIGAAYFQESKQTPTAEDRAKNAVTESKPKR